MTYEAWQRVLEFFRHKRAHYVRCFSTPDGNAVLLDLAIFCRANQSTYDKDQRLSDVLIGRREVWLRIQEYLGLTADQLAELKVKETKREDMKQS